MRDPRSQAIEIMSRLRRLCEATVILASKIELVEVLQSAGQSCLVLSPEQRRTEVRRLVDEHGKTVESLRTWMRLNGGVKPEVLAMLDHIGSYVGMNRRGQGITEAHWRRLFQRELQMAADMATVEITNILVERSETGRSKPEKMPEQCDVLIGEVVKDVYDVFLCHSSADKSLVREIATELKNNGIIPWFDEWELRPGIPWQRTLEDSLTKIRSAAMFQGPSGRGPWQELELDVLLRQFVKRGLPVIPVLLAGSGDSPELPLFLGGMTWVDFRVNEPDPMQQLRWGITGQRPTPQPYEPFEAEPRST